MARPPAFSADKKTTLVLAVLSGEMSAAEAARSAGVSDQAVSVWKRRFVEAGRAGLELGAEQRCSLEVQLSNEVSELKRALGDSYM
jgi:transposase